MSITTKVATLNISDEKLDILRATALREIAFAGDGLGHCEDMESEEFDENVKRAETAISAHRYLQAGRPLTAEHVAFLAASWLNYEVTDEEFSLPLTIEEYQEMQVRLERHVSFIDIRDIATEATS